MLRRAARILAILAVLSVALFYLLHLMPGRAEDALLLNNPEISIEDIEHLRALHGEDRPIFFRYACWLIGPRGSCEWWRGGDGLLLGDLGYSRSYARSVQSLIAERLPRTLSLTLPAFSIALMLSLVLGVYAALHQGKAIDRIALWLSVLSIAAPVHWLGMVAISFFAVGLGWFPSSGVHPPGRDGVLLRVHHAALPVMVLVLLYAGRWTRHLRAAMVETLREDFIQTARAMGLRERTIVWRWALRRAALPLLTVVTQSLPGLFSGALVIERIFAYPGVGLLIFDSVERRDHLVAIVVFLIYAAITMGAMLLADVLYALVDPQGGRGGEHGAL